MLGRSGSYDREGRAAPYVPGAGMESEVKAERTKFYIAAAVAVVFIVIAILFIILFATKSCDKCNECSTSSNSTSTTFTPYSIYFTDPDGNGEQNLQNAFNALSYTAVRVMASKTTSTDGYAGLVVLQGDDPPSTDVLQADLRRVLSPTTFLRVDDRTIDPNFVNVVDTRKTLNDSSCLWTFPTAPPTTTTTTTVITTLFTGTTTTATTTAPPATTCIPITSNDLCCSPGSGRRDIVFAVDVLPALNFDERGTKLDSLKSFLKNFAPDFNGGNSRLGLLAYNDLSLTVPLNFPLNWNNAVDNLVLSSSPTSTETGAIDLALNDILYSNAYQNTTNVVVIIVADHPWDGYKNGLNEALADLSRTLTYNGFYVAAITPAKLSPVNEWFGQLIVSRPTAISPNTIQTYSQLAGVGMGFAKMQICQSCYIVPRPPTTPGTGPTPTTTTPMTAPTSIAQTASPSPSGSPSPNITCGQVDIIIILDSSQSIDETLFNTTIKTFVQKIGQYYSFIGDVDLRTPEYYSQIAVMRFSDKADVLINFTDATTRDGFVNLTGDKVFYKRNGRGNTNTTDALLEARRLISEVNSSRISAKFVLLVTDGVHSPLAEYPDPIPTADALRNIDKAQIICIGLNGTNGDYNQADNAELLAINGGINSSLYTIDYAGLTDALAAQIVSDVKCPVPACKGVVFAVETTEYVGGGTNGSYIQTFLRTVINLVNRFDMVDNTTVYRLVLYSLQAYTPIITDDSQSFRDQIENLMVTISTTQFINGYNYIGRGIDRVNQVLDDLKQNRNINFNAATVFFGQTGNVDGIEDIATSIRRLRVRWQDIFVVDGPQSQGANPDIWGNLTGPQEPPGRIYRMSQSEGANTVTDGIATLMLPVVSNYTCIPPIPSYCPKLMDIVFVVHRATCNSNMTDMINNLVIQLSREFDLDSSLTHVAVLSYDENIPLINNDNRLVLIPMQRWNRNLFEQRVRGIPCMNSTNDQMNNFPDSVLSVLFNFMGPNNFSASGDRQYAANSVIFVTDSPSSITNASFIAAASMLNGNPALDYPNTVFIAIDDSFNYTMAGAQNGTQYDWFNGFFPFNIEQLDPASFYGSEQRSMITDFVCIDKPAPPPCPCTGLGICPATTPTGFYKDEHSLFFYN